MAWSGNSEECTQHGTYIFHVAQGLTWQLITCFVLKLWTRIARQIFKYGIEDLKNSCTERKKTLETSACSAKMEKQNQPNFEKKQGIFQQNKKAYARNRSGSCVEDEKDEEQGQENEIIPEAGILMVVQVFSCKEQVKDFDFSGTSQHLSQVVPPSIVQM